MSELSDASGTTGPADQTGATARHEASADNQVTGASRDNSPGGYSDAEIDAVLAAEEQLPEPRTRQEAAANTWDGDADDAADSDLTAEYDGDVAALLAAEEQLPEPRTRQEAAASTWDDTTSNQSTETDTNTDGTSPSQPDNVTEPTGHDGGGIDSTTDPYHRQVAAHSQDGTEVPINLEYMPPEARTVGDTTPTGIGRKPTGGEFLDMGDDNPDGGHVDKFIREAFEDGDDVRDAFGNASEILHDLRLPAPPGGGHAYEGHPVHETAQPAGPAFSDLFGSAALVSVAILAGIRYGIRRLGEGERK